MKFSIITPVYNCEQFIAHTIESVISQAGNFSIEYILQDALSTDKTLGIIKSYQAKLISKEYKIFCNSVTIIFVSEKDTGMYNAINKGFKKATGDICAWINADDVYQPGAFEAIASTFETFSDIHWIKGNTSVINIEGATLQQSRCYVYNQAWIAKGIYGQQSYFIQQDGVFWRSLLWDKIGSIPEKYTRAGDYWLWTHFAKHASLWSLNVHVSSFRKRPGQISADIPAYKKEQDDIQKSAGFSAFCARLFFSPQSRLYPRFQKFFLALYRIIFWNRNKEYIEIVDGIPIKKQARSFIA